MQACGRVHDATGFMLCTVRMGAAQVSEAASTQLLKKTFRLASSSTPSRMGSARTKEIVSTSPALLSMTTTFRLPMAKSAVKLY